MIVMRAIDSRICCRDIATLPRSGGCNGEEGQGEEEVDESEEAGEKGEEVGQRRPTSKIGDCCHFSNLRRRALRPFGEGGPQKSGTHPPYKPASEMLYPP